MKRGLCVAAAAIPAATMLMAAAPPAQAVPPTPVIVTAGGSDTTQDVMDSIMAQYNNTTLTYGANSYSVTGKNLPAFSATGYSVPGDANCVNPTAADPVVWTKDPLAPSANTAATLGISPFGSGAGRKQLKFEEVTAPANQKGCMDIARSSGGPDGSGTSGTENFAFAMDAVGWASPSLKAPASLTLTQIQQIFTCAITDWSSIPGAGSGPIKVYYPQNGSGTGKFFFQKFLNNVDPRLTPSCIPASQLIEENNGTAIPEADLDKAIVPYSVALWDYQESNHANPTIDKRNRVKIGGFISGAGVNTTANQFNPTDHQYELGTQSLLNYLAAPARGYVTAAEAAVKGVVDEANIADSGATYSAATNYVGVRYLWNVIDANLAPSIYEPAKAVVGFDPAGSFKSALCSGGNQTDINTFGMAELTTANNVGNMNAVGSTCRYKLAP